MKKIAIIGAGLAGLTLASQLKTKAEVTVFEKSRGIGGRMATRYADNYEFDHGAQYFTAKSQAFQTFLKPYIEKAIVKDWQPKLVTINNDSIKSRISNNPSYVASPRMNALAKEMASELNIKGETQIERIEGASGNWNLYDKQSNAHGPYDLVVSAIPSHQAIMVLPNEVSYQSKLKTVKMDACFSLMLGFEEAFNLGFDGAFVEDSCIGWMCANTSKPDRPSGFSIMVQSHNQWAEAHVEDDKEAVKDVLISEASKLTGHNLYKAEHQVLHRWLYASTSIPGGEAFFHDEKNALASIGDWCIKGRVEAAFESGLALAQKLQSEL